MCDPKISKTRGIQGGFPQPTSLMIAISEDYGRVRTLASRGTCRRPGVQAHAGIGGRPSFVDPLHRGSKPQRLLPLGLRVRGCPRAREGHWASGVLRVSIPSDVSMIFRPGTWSI